MKKFFRGFTLAELLLCIGVIGIVSAMGMTVAKIGTDRAYNLYYYGAYENLYNAIADAKAKNIEDNLEIMNHVNNVLSKSNLVANNSNFTCIALKAYAIPTNPCPPGYDYVGGGCVKPEKEQTPDMKPMRPSKGDYYMNDLTQKDLTTKKDDTVDKPNGGDKDDDNTPTNPGSGDGTYPNPGDDDVTQITTSNGVNYYYKSTLSNGLNGFDELTANGITKAIPITMTIPQRVTRTNGGVAVVRFLYVNLGDGYLIPVTDNGSVDLQNRRDLLPAYIDDGIVGRTGNVNAGNWDYKRPVYGSYKDAFCSQPNYAAINLSGVINCSTGFNNISSGRSGVLKVADSRKAR